jgi:hypothetical protein
VTKRTFISLLILFDLALVVVHLGSASLRGEPFAILNLDGEANIPAWWSNAKFVMAGTLFALPAVLKSARSLTPIVLALLLFALAADEIASIHERIGHLLASTVAGDMQFRRKDAFLWPLLLGVPVLIVGAMGLRALAKERFLSVTVWRRVSAALTVFFAGAVGVELVAFNPFVPILQGTPLYQVLAALEEGLEHVGASLLVWAALTAFSEHFAPAKDSATIS